MKYCRCGHDETLHTENRCLAGVFIYGVVKFKQCECRRFDQITTTSAPNDIRTK